MVLTDKLTVEWLKRLDFEDVLEIEKESFEFPWSEKDLINVFKVRSNIGLVATMEDKILGYVIYSLENGYLHLLTFAIAKQYRRKGVGTFLINKLKGKIASQCRQAIELEIRETNLGGQLFFKSNGFKAIGVLKNYYDCTIDDAYSMKYSLANNYG